MKNILQNQISSLKSIVDNIDYEYLKLLTNDCVNAINNNKSIIATGLGKNQAICEKFIGTLTSLGIKSNFLNTNSAIHGDLGNVHEGDIVLMLTKSGETPESIFLYKYLKNKGAKIWLLTFSENSTLSYIIDNKIIMKLNSEGDPWNLVPNNSSIGYLLLLQGLAMQLLYILNIDKEDFKNNHPGGHIGLLLLNGEDSFNERNYTI